MAGSEAGPLRVLVLTSRFPDAVRPTLGIIMARQILALARREGVEVEVIAPLRLPVFPLSLAQRHRRLRAIPLEERWEGLSVRRPRYRTLPKRVAHEPRVLARTLLPLLRGVRERFAYDIVAAQFFWPEGPASVFLGEQLGVPVSIKGRGPDVEMKARDPRLRQLIVEAGKEADGVLAISEDLKERMAALGMPKERIEVHYTGIDRSLFRVREMEAEKAALGLSGPVLLTAGNLIPRKGHLLLIEALRLLDGATLLVAGTGPEMPLLRKRARELGVERRVRFLGVVPHHRMPRLYSAADVTVHGASLEGLSNVLVESLACGTPVVATAVGGAGEAVTRMEAGRLVRQDPAAIAAAVRELLINPPPRELVASSVASFSWERSGATLEAHLRAVVEGYKRQARRPA